MHLAKKQQTPCMGSVSRETHVGPLVVFSEINIISVKQIFRYLKAHLHPVTVTAKFKLLMLVNLLSNKCFSLLNVSFHGQRSVSYWYLG